MKCNLCPRKCNIDRSSQRGFCSALDQITIARSGMHKWEEPCISGINGSGTIFFSGCNMKCVFCQNYQISRSDVGLKISIEQLAQKMIELQKDGAHNINLVTATHFVDKVADAIRIAKGIGLDIPIVYNTSSYENVESIKLLEGLVDIYLPDFKYFDNDIAVMYSKAQSYREIAMAAIDEMVRQQANLKYDDDGMLTNGVIVRHMILPGRTNDSKRVIECLHRRYGDKISISIMNQYTPVGNCGEFKELDRKITKREYEKVINFAIDIGVQNGFIQEGDVAKESFIPDFDLVKEVNDEH